MTKKTKDFLVILGITLVYAVAANLSLNLAFAKTNASPIWPPSGIAFAAVLIFGRRALWGIFAGAVIANLLSFQDNFHFSSQIVLCSIMIGAGNTLEAFLSENFFRSFSGKSNVLDTYSDFFRMLMVTFAACLAGALIGAVSLQITGIVPLEFFKTVLITWWLGDYVGMIIVTPLILSIARFASLKGRADHNVEFLIHLVVLIVVSTTIFSNIGSGTILSEMSFIILPFLLWMVYRFSVPYIALSVTVVSLIAVFGTVNGYGPFHRSDLNDSLLLLQAFLGITCVTFMSLSITIKQKDEKEAENVINSLKYPMWFASIGFIVCLSVSLFVIYTIDIKKDRQILARIGKDLDFTNSSMKWQLKYIGEGLDRMAERRENFPGLRYESWEKDTKRYFEDYGVFKTIEWVDASYRVKWAYSKDDSAHALGLNLNFDSRRKYLLDTAKNTSSIMLSKPMDLINGGRGVLFAVPIGYGETFNGFILGICELDVLFETVLKELEKKYFVEINVDNIAEYQSDNFKENYFNQSGSGEFSDLQWNVTLVPRPEFLKVLGKEPNTFSIVIGFLISVLFSLTVYLVINSRSKAASLSQLNENLILKNEELNLQREISQQAALAKTQFLANMSHEIRTPMNGVLGALQLALDSPADDVKNYLKVIDISARNLLDIINDILDYSKIEAGKMELEVIPFDLRKIIQESLIVVEGKAKTRNVELFAEFKLNSENNFKGDPTRIRQILLNLLSNAVKFTENGEVKVFVRQNEAKQLIITVQDSGIGIPKEQLGSIFDQFEQADKSTTREYGGTGLGLAITKQLVDLMDGTIKVESELNKGAAFTVTLPLEETDIKVVEQAMDLERKYGKRVLLCEDNTTNRKVIKEILERLGIEVEVAIDGVEAVEAAQRGSYDLILMDLHMPKMDGLQSSAEIMKASPDLPIVVLTAATEEDVKEDCLNAGIKGFLTKPVQKQNLVNELDKWLGKAS